MKQFYKTNTITHNLLSLTGFKSMIIFSLLVESPKSYKEIQQHIKEHEYLHEDLSVDALRIYINTLKNFGCNIKRINDNGTYKYTIDDHPFQLKIDDSQAQSIIKIYKTISKSIDVNDLIILQSFFKKISIYITNEDLKNKLNNLSPISNIDINLIKQLKHYAENTTEITIYYNSAISGRKNITVLTDKINVENGKLYIYGFNSEHNNYAKFLVSRIIKIVSVNLSKKTLPGQEYTVGYEYTKDINEEFETLENEKIISETNNKLIVELTSRSKFELIQRIMFLSKKCKVLYPEDFKSDIIATLKKMKEGYFEK